MSKKVSRVLSSGNCDKKSGTSDLSIIMEGNNNEPDNVNSYCDDELIMENNNESVPPVTRCDLLLLILPLLGYTYNYISDIRVFINLMYLKITYGFLAVFVILFPALTTIWMSFHMRRKDLKEEQHEKENTKKTSSQEIQPNPCTNTFLLFILPLPLRYLNCLHYASKVRECRKKPEGETDILLLYYRKWRREQADVALLNIVGCLEAKMQIILQLYILLTESEGIKKSMYSKIGSCCWTLLVLAWSVRSYHCIIRHAQPDKAKISSMGSALLFLRILFIISSRILLITITLTMWPLYTSIVCMVICILWTIWIYNNEDGAFCFCQDGTSSALIHPTVVDKIKIFLVSAVFSVVYIFDYINLTDKPTFVKQLVYYALYLLQIIVAIALWLKYGNPTSEYDGFFTQQFFFVLLLILFFIGIVFLVIYYKCFHPRSGQSECCVQDTEV